MPSVLSLVASLGVLAVVAYGGCGRHAVNVEFYLVDGYSFAPAEREAIQTVADATAREVRALLPALPRDLVLKVYAGADVIPETGETGAAVPPATVMWTVDPKRSGGVIQTVHAQLRASLFHQFHHLARYRTVPRSRSLIDNVVAEGLATAFERDFSAAAPPWGQYPADVDRWVAELLALPSDASLDVWLVRHPDGRRWIGLRAGTYLVDQVVSRTSKSAATLVDVATQEIVAMAREVPDAPSGRVHPGR